MKIPGPDHPITISPAPNRWRARFNGHVIADSPDALILEEAGYPPRLYFPREDISMEFLTRTAHTTHCPYKGDASYYTLIMDGHFLENVAWTYENPYPAVNPIAGRLSFYAEQVELYEVADAAVNPHHVKVHPDDAVQHTDAGDGHAQREHWPPTVDTPGQEGGVR
jgi:uncharacterized protein (DUF427 family)